MPKVDLLGPHLELPEGWRGVSFVFVAPPAKGGATAGLPTLAAPVGFRETISVAIEPVPKGTTPLAYHEAQLQQLQAGGQRVSVLSKAEREHRGAPALLVELKLVGPRGEQLRQLHLIAVTSASEVMIGIATTLDGPGYPIAKKNLTAALETLSI